MSKGLSINKFLVHFMATGMLKEQKVISLELLSFNRLFSKHSSTALILELSLPIISAFVKVLNCLRFTLQ